MTQLSIHPITSTIKAKWTAEDYIAFPLTAEFRGVIVGATDAMLIGADCVVQLSDRSDRESAEHFEKVFAASGIRGLVSYERGSGSDGNEPAEEVYIHLFVPSEELARLTSTRKAPPSIRVNSLRLPPDCTGVLERGGERILALTGFEFVLGEDFTPKGFFRAPVLRAYEKSIGEMKGEKRGLAYELMLSIQAWSVEKEICAADLEEEVKAGLKLVDDMHEAMNPFCHFAGAERALEYYRKKLSNFEKDRNQMDWIWRPRNLRSAIMGGENDDEYWPPGNDVSGLVAEYLRKPWATCASLERLLLDFLIYNYGLEIHKDVKSLQRGLVRCPQRWIARRGLSYRAAKKAPPSTAGLLIGGIISLALAVAAGYGAWRTVGWWAGLFVYELTSMATGSSLWGLHVSALKEQDAKSRICETVLEDVMSAYELQRNVNSPLALGERFRHLANEGIDWPLGVMELIEHAERRNAYRW